MNGDDARLAAIDGIPGLVWSARPDGHVEFWNRQWCDYTGLSQDQATGWGWLNAVSPEDQSTFAATWRDLMRIGEPAEAMARLRRFDGEVRWFLFRAAPQLDRASRVVGWYGQTTEIEAQKRAETLLEGEKRLLERIVRAEGLSFILEGVCRLVESAVPDQACSILLVDHQGRCLRHGAAPSLPRSYSDAIDGRPLGMESGPCAMAAELRQQVISDDVAHETRWRTQGWPNLAQSHGLAACWSTPFFSSQGSVLGVLSLYAKRPGVPSLEVQHVITQMTHLAAVAIERDQTEAALRSSEQRFRLMADAIPEVIWIADLHPRRVIYASPSFSRVWGHSVEALETWPTLWTDAVHPDDRERVVRAFDEWSTSPGRSEYDVEFRIARPDGDVRWVHERAVLMGGEAGGPHRASGISTDVTHRHLADEERRHADAVRLEIERLSRTGSSCWKPPAEELAWSPEMFEIFDVPADVTPTVHLVRDRIHPEDLDHFNRTVERAVLGGLDFAVEVRLLMADGAIKYLQVITHAFRDPSGVVTEFIGAVKDVTDTKRTQNALGEMRDALAHATRVAVLGELTASIAHELNQPLLGIVTNASTCLHLLGDVPPDINGAMDTARRTMRDGNRAAEVVARLRALFKKSNARPEPFTLNESIEEIVELVQNDLHKAHVVLTCDLAPDLAMVVGDRVQIQQVILNLVMNACEAMEGLATRPRELLIATVPSETGAVRVTVRDSGHGVAPEIADRLFQPFVTSKSNGMGIGLSLCRSIVDTHGGTLHLVRRDGPGAEFELTLPTGQGEFPQGADRTRPE